jgi:uncharacterized Zn-binding protein involved in type VI secretion
MIAKRYYIRAGATTTAGGVVRASSELSNVGGAAQARDGDPVDCPACGIRGVIKCVLPRISDTLDGKEYALSDDLCVCNCNPAPKLIADQDYYYQIFALASVESAEQAAARKASTNATEELMPLRFLDEATGQPHSHRRYRIELTGGGILEGTTDANGLSNALTKAERGAIAGWTVLPEVTPHA